MRKINDTELQEMLDNGKSQKECAEYYGVSPSAINQRIKKLTQGKEPESFNKLTTRKKNFVKAKVAGETNQVAVQCAYDVTTSASAKSIATDLMKDPDINKAIHDLMYSEGLGKRRRVQRLRDMIESPDMSAVGKGLDMSFKLTGEYSPEKVEVISDHEIRMLIANITTDKEAVADTGTPSQD